MARHAFYRRRITTTVALWLLGSAVQAANPTLSQELLRSYFDTAGVCTTSQVSNIRDDGDIVTIEIAIEAGTREGLTKMQNSDRDNWFSLHCPPEIHGVWRQAHPPSDILVTGKLGAEQAYTLSCVEFQRNQWGVRELTIRDKIQRWLEEKLD